MLIDIKLLNTILSGCEYTINQDNLFIIVNKKWLTQQEGISIPNDGILIPTDDDTPCNFSIKFPTDNESDYKILIHFQDKNRQDEEVPLSFNHIHTIGSVQFAAKLVNDSWNYEIASPHQDAELTKRLTFNKNLPFLQRFSKKYILYFLIGTILFGGCGVAWYNYTEAERREQHVSDLFADGDNVFVVLGSDKNVYIFAKDKKGMQFVFDTLKNSPLESLEFVKIKNRMDEKREMMIWLTKYWPGLKWNSLNLDDLESPTLFLSQQRDKPLTSERKKEFINEFKKFAPYTKSITFSYLDDAILIQQAEDGLNQLNVEFQQKMNPSYMSFIIQGELDDSDLLRLKQFVNRFYQTWGDNYIRFVVTVHRDFLKNYSFKNGPQNYIKISNNHWYIKM